MTTSTIISVPNDERLHRILAEAVVEVSHPGYQRKGWYVNVNTWEVFSPVNNTDVSDNCFDVANFFDSDNDYDPSVDWGLAWDEHDFLREMLLDWAKNSEDKLSDKEIRDDNGDLLPWVYESHDLAIEWGWSQPQWKDQLKEIEKTNYEKAVDFAEMNILSKVEIG